MTDTVTVQLTDVTRGAVLDTLLAVEAFATRVYSNRSGDPESQDRYNALADIVLPLRLALDAP